MESIFSQDSTVCLPECERCSNLNELLAARRDQDLVISHLQNEKKELQDQVQLLEATVEVLESDICRYMRSELYPGEELTSMHSHCTVDTCWRQKYAESFMQLRTALIETKQQLEKLHPGDEKLKHKELHMIEESLRSIGPVAPSGPMTRKRLSSFEYPPPREFKIPHLARSDSRTSFIQRPFLRRVLNIFKRKDTSANAKRTQIQ